MARKKKIAQTIENEIKTPDIEGTNTFTPVEEQTPAQETYRQEKEVCPKPVEAEILDMDTINANDEAEQIVNDSVCVCYNGVQALEMETPYGTFHINSNSEKFRGTNEMFTLPARGSYGITTNIPRKAWEWFSKVYKDWGEIKTGLLFACDISEVRTKIKEHKGISNGFEPLDFEGEDPRLGRKQ